MRFVPSEKFCPFFLLFPAVKEKIPLLNKYRPAYLYAWGGGGSRCTQNREQVGTAADGCYNPPKPRDGACRRKSVKGALSPSFIPKAKLRLETRAFSPHPAQGMPTASPSCSVHPT